jgi:hypothetical protein
MKTFFDFALPLQDNTLMTTVRLSVGGLAAAAGLDVDEAEDFKVCVTESLLLFKRNGFALAKAHFELEEGNISAVLVADGEGEKAAERETEDEISYALLGALMDDVRQTRDEGGRVKEIVLQKAV